MKLTLDSDQVLLLTAVEQGRVHTDPRYTNPDFEKDPDVPLGGLRRATQRLAPLKKARLVELDPDVEPDQYGVRPYKLTALGEQVLAQARQLEADARAEAGA